MITLTGTPQFYNKFIDCATISNKSGKCKENERSYNFYITHIILRTDKCDEYKDFFESALKEIVAPALDKYGLKITNGPNYIQLGAALGDQGIALMLMAIGDYFGWWTAGTPSDILGIETPVEQNIQLASSGMILIALKEELINIIN